MADRTTLPTLHSLAEIVSATGWSLRTVQRKLAAHPEIRSIGRGKGRRYTTDDFFLLIDLERAKNPSSSPVRHSGDDFKHSIHSDTRILAKDLRASMFP